MRAGDLGTALNPGAVTGMGFATPNLTQGFASVSGVAALAAAYPRAFDLLRYAGAAYLAWIGFALIWFALGIFSADALSRTVRARAGTLQAS